MLEPLSARGLEPMSARALALMSARARAEALAPMSAREQVKVLELMSAIWPNPRFRHLSRHHLPEQCPLRLDRMRPGPVRPQTKS